MKKKIIFSLIITLICVSSKAQNSDLSKILDTDCVYNFSYKQYFDFLQEIKKIPEIEFVTQQKFNTYYDSTKIIVSIKHDIDVDIHSAIILARIEKELNIPTTYFVLHTAKFYHPPKDFATHNDSILAQLQNIKSSGHEIGFHNDLLTLQVVYGISPRQFLKNELEWLRSNEIEIWGTSSHGSSYCYQYGYINYFFFYESSLEHENASFPNENFVIKKNETIYFEKATLSEYDLEYESYSLDFNKYFSDASTNKDGSGYNPTTTDTKNWKAGDRIVILTHPGRWRNFEKRALTVNPNPNNNNFHIYSDDIPENTEIKIEISNIQGKTVYFENKKFTNKLPVTTNLKSGIYILKVSFFAGEKFTVLTTKLVIS